MSDAALRLTGISKTYSPDTPNAVEVLAGVDLTVASGETVALMAPSGSGKSTLLHIAGLLDQASGGSVAVGGVVTDGLGDAARTTLRRDKIGFVYQFHHLLPEFSALENVAMPMRGAGVTRDDALDRALVLLDQVGLKGRADHRPAELSGGEQQRAAICRALANGPGLLLADEPTGNLDPETSDAVFAVLLEQARTTGLAALVATHNPSLAQKMDRVVRLDGGRLTDG